MSAGRRAAVREELTEGGVGRSVNSCSPTSFTVRFGKNASGYCDDDCRVESITALNRTIAARQNTRDGEKQTTLGKKK